MVVEKRSWHCDGKNSGVLPFRNFAHRCGDVATVSPVSLENGNEESVTKQSRVLSRGYLFSSNFTRTTTLSLLLSLL